MSKSSTNTLTVRDLMVTEVITVSPTATVGDASI